MNILIIGDFLIGKKSFINSLLCESILPISYIPFHLLCETTYFFKIAYGDDQYVVLTLKNPITDSMIEYASRKALAHIAKYGSSNVPPLVLNETEFNEELNHYCNMNIANLESIFSNVEFVTNNHNLKGISLYVSNGIYGPNDFSYQLFDLANTSDAIIFLLDATRACTHSEMELVDRLPKKKLFFVVNKMEQLENNEREQLIEFVNHKLSNYTSYPISYVSSFLALEAIKNSDVSLYQESGIPFIISNLMINMSKFRNMQ